MNPCLEVDQYPLSKTEDLLASLAGSQKFTTWMWYMLTRRYSLRTNLDSTRRWIHINGYTSIGGYHLVLSQHLPFFSGWWTAYYRAYHTLYGILMTYSLLEQMSRNIYGIWKRLQEHSIRLRMKKCSYFQKSVEFLGHLIDAKGLHTMSKKVETIQLAPTPKDQSNWGLS